MQATDTTLKVAEKEALQSYPLVLPQFKILLRDYLDITAYPNFKDFDDYAKGRILMDDIPDHDSCLAYLTGNPLLEKLGNSLEALLGSWYPDQETEREIKAIRKEIRDLV